MEISVKSATYAMKAKQILNKSGIRAYVGKKTGDTGCYYYLNVADKDVESAVMIMRMNGLK